MIIEVSRSLCKVILVGLVICLAGGIYWYMNYLDPLGEMKTVELESGVEDREAQSSEVEASDDPDSEASEVMVLLAVHVSGAVVEPDFVYYLEEGSRVEDAVRAAGGALEEADLSALNLARLVQDGERIYVPKEGEVPEAIIDTGIQDVVENQEKPLTNINLATTIELMELPGIGETYAKRIVEYRDANGGFQKIEEIKNVSGIGDSTYEKIKDMITVSG